jgi:hypothetical protein
VLGDPAAVCLWLALTCAGLVAALVAGNAVWVLIGWAAGGVTAAIVVAVTTRRDR